jgi:hypothetical protein
VRKTLRLPVLAVGGMLAAVLAVSSPAYAAPSGPASSPVAAAAAKPPPPPPPSPANFIEGLVDSRSTNNEAAFGNDVFPTSDGGYIVTGGIGVTPHNGYVGKLSSAGKFQWQEQLGTGDATFTSVQQTSDGGYILAGGINSDNAWVVKLGSAGTLQWQEVFPGAQSATASQIKQTSDGAYIVVGNTTDSTGTEFAWIAKLSSTGALQWQQQLGSSSFAAAFSVQQTSDGGYIISGTSGVIGSSSVLVAKFSSAGAVQWQQTYGTGNEDNGNSVQQTSDGGYVVGGEVVTANPDGSRPGEALLLKLTSTGAIQFQDVFNANIGLDRSSDATSVKQTPDGGYILAGTDGFAQNSGPTTASWLARTTATGALSWQHVFLPASDFSNFGSVRLTSDGGFVAVGTADVDFSDSIWLVKTDTNGNVAGASSSTQLPGTTNEQAGALTATTTNFPTATPANGVAAIADSPVTANLVIQSFG